MILHAPAVDIHFLPETKTLLSHRSVLAVRGKWMAKYIINKDSGIPTCTICGRPLPHYCANMTEINLDDVRHCYFCGMPMERFYYPGGKDK